MVTTNSNDKLDRYGRTKLQAKKFKMCHEYAVKRLACIKQYFSFETRQYNDTFHHEIVIRDTDSAFDGYFVCYETTIIDFSNALEYCIEQINAGNKELTKMVLTHDPEGLDDYLNDKIKIINPTYTVDGKPIYSSEYRDLNLTASMYKEFTKGIDKLVELLPKLVEAMSNAKLMQEIEKI